MCVKKVPGLETWGDIEESRTIQWKRDRSKIAEGHETALSCEIL